MSQKKLSYFICSAVILVLIWSQLSFVFFQAAHIIHYTQLRNNSDNAGKYKDTLVFTKAEFEKIQWVTSDEISCQGRMFDVEKQLSTKDRELLIGHFDEKDDQLFAAISSFFEHGKDIEDQSTAFNILMIEAVIAQPFSELYISYTLLKSTNGERPGTRYKVHFHDNTFQPPEFS